MAEPSYERLTEDELEQTVPSEDKYHNNSTVAANSGMLKIPNEMANNLVEHSLNKDASERHKEKEEEALPPVAYFSLFRYSSCFDKFLIAVACLASAICGSVMPITDVFLGNTINMFIEHPPNNTNSTGFLEETLTLSITMLILGASMVIFYYIMTACLIISAENQIFRIRQLFIKSILSQDISWFDVHQRGDFASRTTADLIRVQDGISEKLGLFVIHISTSVIATVWAFYYGWKLTLVILAAMPALMIVSAAFEKVESSLAEGELSAYSKAGSIAEEVFSSIKTVVAFGGEQKEIERYSKELIPAKQSMLKRGFLLSLNTGLFWFFLFATFALGYWYGAKLILESSAEGTKEYTVGSVLIIFFNATNASLSLTDTVPYLETFSLARGAAANVFNIISRVSIINSQSEEGTTPDIQGHVILKDIRFQYPSRPDVKILKGLTLEVHPGETIALVGPSGCGKSTVLQLLQRFYDPSEGEVMFDSTDIRDMNVGWLRDHIGVVGQEPVLFGTSIAENIRYGYPSASQEDIERAAKDANAHHFIMKLPDKYETKVGQRGAQMSGGQKQRISIARALVRNPKILLLDEATSALDLQSESVVQAALDKARKGRTTFIVAHRLSTIRTADKIAAVKDGVIAEIGSHDELMKKEGLYYQLVMSQQVVDKDESGDEEEKEQVEKAEERDPERTRLMSQTSMLSNLSHGSTGDGTPLLRDEDFTFPDQTNQNEKQPGVSRILKMAIIDWPYITFGCLCAFIMGTTFPAYSIVLGDLMMILSSKDAKEVHEAANWYAVLFVIVGIVSGVTSFFQMHMFNIAGSRLTLRVRHETFKALLRQEIGWYDLPENSTGSVCSRLATDAASVQGAVGTRLSAISQAISTLICAITISVWFNWKLGLVAFAFVPFIVLGAYFQSQILNNQILIEREAMEEANKIAIEAISSIRTVASLHLESMFCNQYLMTLLGSHKSAKRKAHCRALLLGLSRAISPIAYFVVLIYGSILIYQNELHYGDLIKLLEGVIIGIDILGSTVAYAPDYQRAKLAALNIFKILDRKPSIDSFACSGEKPEACSGKCDLKSVHFTYPTRPDAKVLRRLNLHVVPGQSTALVGTSGCGKSTIVQLLQRYYDCDKGEVRLDDKNIKDLNIPWLRSQFGSVSQEPVLFSYSIAENIAYGDNTRSVPMDEIIFAARQANIHNFIQSLPAGYETSVGEKGSQLSGGQKQRIAIARALVRNPQVLLLDEATSALDVESEKVVQEALDKAMIGRTSIIIAHRLSTIQNADKICVIQQGKLVEEGTHQQLLAKRNFYYKLYSVQEMRFQNG